MDFAAPIVDTHTHTNHSDGAASLLENARAAVAAGCAIMCATDHLTIPDGINDDAVGVEEADLPAVARDVAEARELVPELELVFGWECDWYEGCEEHVPRYSEGATFRLGSVHMIDAKPIDWDGDLRIYEELGANGMWRAYAEAWCRACESPLAFDTMAHPDLAMRFAREGWHVTCDLTGVFREMAVCARDTGRRVEVSTAGLRKGVGTYYPNHELLVLFREAGVPITVGSDAHTPADVADNIDGAYAYAWSAGYRSIECPRADGDWTTFEL